MEAYEGLPQQRYSGAQQFITDLVGAEERQIDRILIRPVNQTVFAGQYWVRGDAEPELFTIVAPDLADTGEQSTPA